MRSVFLVLALWILQPASALAVTPGGEPASAPKSSYTGADGSWISVTAKASTTTPYQNQPIQYIVRCVARGNVSEVSLGDLNISNAIVEPSGQPDVHGEVENGIAVRVAEFRYIITPLQPGKITIPSVVLHGKFGPPDLTAAADPFGGKISSGMQQALNFFNAYGSEPFDVTSNPTVLNVRAPAAAMDPWLPLTALKIMEDTDTPRSARVGEPFTRKITLLADSAVGSQLPALAEQQDHVDFKVYADRPTMGENIDAKSGAIFGWRKESYSLIAQKPGRLILPAIKVSWWDIVNNKAATASLPSRVITVLPAAGATDQGAKPEQHAAVPSSGVGRSILWYWLVAVLGAVLVFAIVRGLRLWRGVNRIAVNSASVARAAGPVPEKTSRPAVERSLDHMHTAEELKDFLQAYAHERWNVSKNASLEAVFAAMPKLRAAEQNDDVEAVIEGLTAALYADRAIDLEDLKQRCRRILAASESAARNRRNAGETLPSLNPS